jgi:beta-1,4-mannosyltransferase
VRVLLSVRESATKINPFVTLLVDALREDGQVEVEFFSWPAAFSGRYDVFHIHWPEAITRGPSRFQRAASLVLSSLLLARLRLTRTGVVRTAHNLTPHESGWPGERGILHAYDRATTEWITMNRHTPVPARGRRTVIPHGHYRDRYQAAAPSTTPGRTLLYFGLVRSYKGVDALATAFSKAPALADFRLRILGKPDPSGVSPELQQLIADDPRIEPDFRYVPDDELAAAIAESRLVVLPYRKMHNSGAVLLALSLHTPVLVPDNPITQDLRDEFGGNVVKVFSGDLTSDALSSAVAELADDGVSEPIDMTSRDWSTIARSHVDVYRRAGS